MQTKETDKIIKAGKIAKQVKEYAKSIVKKDKPLLEIAEQIEDKIIELGGKPAFPTNLSINDIAAHYTPTHDDETKAHGLLKVDFGVHIDGFIADTAFSVDLENDEENQKLIKASEEALANAIGIISNKSSEDKLINKNKGVGEQFRERKVKLSTSEVGSCEPLGEPLGGNARATTSQIGATIQQTIESHGFSPIINLSGHSMEEYELHSGITIPNIDDKKNIELKDGVYAIEPFATSGNGKVYDGKPSGIYYLQNAKNIRSQIAREVLDFIGQEYQTLPFCSRWIVKKFGTKSLFALRQLEQANILHEFPQLVETSHKPVSQAEDTILIEKDKVEVTTD